MVDLIGLFKDHICDLFDENAEYESDEISKIRIDQPNGNSKVGFKKARSIILNIDTDVILSFTEAKQHQLKEFNNYKFSLRRLIIRRLAEYDPDGDKNTAFKIQIDSRAMDL